MCAPVAADRSPPGATCHDWPIWSPSFSISRMSVTRSPFETQSDQMAADRGARRRHRRAMLGAMGAALHTGPLRGHHVELVPLERSFADELAVAAAGDRSSFGWTEVPDGAEATARYIDNLLAQRRSRRVRPFRPAPPGVGAARRVHALHGAAPLVRARRARRGGDRRHLAERRRAAQRRSTPRPSCCCSPTPSTVWRRATGRAEPPTRATSAAAGAIERIGASVRGRAAPPPPVEGRRRARPAAQLGDVRGHRRRLAGGGRAAACAPRPTRPMTTVAAPWTC